MWRGLLFGARRLFVAAIGADHSRGVTMDGDSRNYSNDTCTVNFYLRSSHRNLIDVSNTTFQREPEFQSFIISCSISSYNSGASFVWSSMVFYVV